MVLVLQSNAVPAAISHTSPTPSLLQSACVGFAIVGQLSRESTRPSLSVSTPASAMVWYPPPAIFEHGPRPAGWPLPLRPQHRTKPSLRSAMVWELPPATLEHGPRSAGVLHWPPVLRPQHRTKPSACAFCATIPAPVPARNAATSPDFARSPQVRPVCFDLFISTEGTTEGPRSQQHSRARYVSG